MTQVELVEVTQADRDAAASYWKSQGIGTPASYRALKSGGRDDSDLVQAFARHRLSATPVNIPEELADLASVLADELIIRVHDMVDGGEGLSVEDQRHLIAQCIKDRKRAMRASTPDVKELVEALEGIFAKLDDGLSAPGHGHSIPGIWDDDVSNGERAGKPCEWCTHWERARAALAKASGVSSHG